MIPESLIEPMYWGCASLLAVLWITVKEAAGPAFSLFWWHPVLMAAGWFFFVGSAVLIKKIGGRRNTLIHAGQMFLAILCICGGFYAIFQNKINLKHDHFTSLHSKFGLASICLIFMPFLAGILISPDWGPLRSNGSVRLVHKYVGRCVFTVGFTTIILGYFQVNDQALAQGIFATLAVITVLLLWLVQAPDDYKEKEKDTTSEDIQLGDEGGVGEVQTEDGEDTRRLLNKTFSE